MNSKKKFFYHYYRKRLWISFVLVGLGVSLTLGSFLIACFTHYSSLIQNLMNIGMILAIVSFICSVFFAFRDVPRGRVKEFERLE